MRNSIFLGMVIFLVMMVSTISRGETKESQESVEPLDVLIKGKAKDLVDIEKSLPQVDIDLEGLASSSAEMTENLLEKGIEVPNKSDFEQFNSLESGQVAQPHLPDLSEPPLVRFYPKLSNTSVKRWELVITDEKGDNIRTLKGIGFPTKTIKWDGINKKGEIINVGTLYSYRFVATDVHNNLSTVEGKSFILDVLKYKEGKKIVIEVDNNVLYVKDSAEISEKAKLILEKIVDILREYSHYPFAIKLYVHEDNSPLARKKRDIVREFIAKRLPLLPEEVDIRLLKKDNRGAVTAFIIKR